MYPYHNFFLSISSHLAQVCFFQSSILLWILLKAILCQFSFCLIDYTFLFSTLTYLREEKEVPSLSLSNHIVPNCFTASWPLLSHNTITPCLAEMQPTAAIVVTHRQQHSTIQQFLYWQFYNLSWNSQVVQTDSSSSERCPGFLRKQTEKKITMPSYGLMLTSTQVISQTETFRSTTQTWHLSSWSKWGQLQVVILYAEQN